MATRSVYSIDIDDTAFKRFAETFAKFQEQLKKTPQAWAELGKETKGTAVNFENLTAALLAQATFAHELNQESDKQTKHVERQASAWERMAKSSRGVASHILDATKSLLRWGEITGIVSGLLGAGGLFGIERLAQGASGLRRSASGFGASVGGQQAFEAAFGRVVDPQSVLSGVSQGMYDVRGRLALMAAGLTPNKIRPGRDVADVAADLIPALKKLADQTPDQLLGNVLTSRHLDQFIGLQDFIRLKNRPGGELSEYEQAYPGLKERLKLDPKTQRVWDDFNVQLLIAGKVLKTAFIDNLEPLAPALKHLSEGFTNLVTSVLKMAKQDGWIDQAAAGFEWLAKEIGSDEFKKGVADFAHDIVLIAKRVGQAFAWIEEHWPSSLGLDRPTDPGSGNLRGPMPGTTIPFTGGAVRQQTAYFRPASNSFSGPQGSGSGNFSDLESRFGLPPGSLYNIEGIESGHSNVDRFGRPLVSSAGALGWMQFLPSTWAEFGPGDPFNRRDSAEHGAKFLRKLLNKFGGNLEEAVAGYNAGPGRVEDAVRRLGGRWLSGLPAETQNYVHKFFANSDPRLRNPNVKVHLDVNNQAGANVAFSASQLVNI